MFNFIDNKELLINKSELDRFKIKSASLENAFNLLDCVSKALKNDLGIDIQSDQLNFKDNSNALNIIFKMALSLIGSPEIRDSIFKCLEKSTYTINTVGKAEQPITMAAFQDENNRKYFIPVMVECLKINLTPFLSGLLTKLMDMKLIENIDTQNAK